ncbi:MAG: LiaI-LiaF-like domain-containing protein [Spirosomataceae bacterium]
MKTNQIVSGVLFILLGLYFLASNFGLVDVSLRDISPYWPLLIVLAGVLVLVDPAKRLMNPSTIVVLVLAIPLAIHSSTVKVSESISSFEWSDEEDYENFEEEREQPSDTKLNNQVYSVELQPTTKKAKLAFKSGLAGFQLAETSTFLFESDVTSRARVMKLSEEVKEDEQVIQFSDNSSKKWSRKLDSSNENIVLKLNKKPIWDIDLSLGLGELDFDFSDYRVEKLNVESGLASLKLRLGNKVQNSEIEVKSGLAEIKIEVPENVGCEIKTSGALNGTTFPGFEQIDSKKWRSIGYDKATNKMSVRLEGGLSDLSVSRY